jgi:hypothetical protein
MKFAKCLLPVLAAAVVSDRLADPRGVAEGLRRPLHLVLI